MEPLKSTDIIKPTYYAYHIGPGNKIDDVMTRIGGGYTGKPVQQLIDDGWSFVCRSKKYKKGQTVDVKPMSKTERPPVPATQNATSAVPSTRNLCCPHCNGLLRIQLIGSITLTKVES